MEDLLYYQLKSEIALEEGDVEEAMVWATLANSAATAMMGRGPNMLRGPISPEAREDAKERAKNGERPQLPIGPGGPPVHPGSGGRTPVPSRNVQGRSPIELGQGG